MKSIRIVVGSLLLCLACLGPVDASLAALAPVVTLTNAPIRIMAANLTGNPQTYEAFAVRLFQGLKPDVVAIQEFNYQNNTGADIRDLVTTAFGPEFVFYREPGYAIPNGVISRFPIRAAGSWNDALIPDRGFAWARLDVPGTNDLYVVSVHFKASSGGANATKRANQAAALKALIAQRFPAQAWIVVAGDLNTQTRAETALTTLKSFLRDTPIPTDRSVGGDPDTNASRSKPYDYVLPSVTFATNRVATFIGARSYPNGLVFDSRVFTPLGDVTPVQYGDSGQAQHMAVIKDFQIHYAVTNYVSVPAPELSWRSENVIHWEGLSNLTYTVQGSPDLLDWRVASLVHSATRDYFYTNSSATWRFFRVVYP